MNKKSIGIIISIIIIIFIIVSLLYIVKASNTNLTINDKSEDEIRYISKEIIEMLNKLNNISLSNGLFKEENQNEQQKEESSKDNNQKEENDNKKFTIITNNSSLNTNDENIDWNDLNNDCEKLYDIWTNTIIDLYTANVNNEDILNFSKTLDMVTLSIKSNDKKSSINNLISLYSYIPKYLEELNADKKKINIENTKYSLLKSYLYVEENNWIYVQEELQNSLLYYLEIINSAKEDKEHARNKITKTYVLLNELNNSINLKDKDIYYLKYRDIIEELIEF